MDANSVRRGQQWPVVVIRPSLATFPHLGSLHKIYLPLFLFTFSFFFSFPETVQTIGFLAPVSPGGRINAVNTVNVLNAVHVNTNVNVA